MLGFFGLDPLTLVAASDDIPALSGTRETDPNQIADNWVSSLSEKEARACLRRLLAEDAVSVKAELLAKSHHASARSFQMILDRSEQLRDEETRREQRKQAAKAKREAKKKERERHRVITDNRIESF